MSAAELRILADDLTGALDSAAAFAGEVPVYLDAPPPAPDAAVSAVATATRDIAPADLPAALAPALAWFGSAGIAFKKVDSLLRGNTFVECAHLARAGGFERIVFAPAYPQQGRLTLGGRAVVQQPGASQAQPIGAASIAEAFGALDIALSVPEVRSDDDLLGVAREAASRPAERVLWCGSAGLAQALANVLGRRAAAAATPPVAAGPVLLLGASHHAVVRRQWEALDGAGLRAVRAGRRAGETLDAALAAMQRPFELALLDLSPAHAMSADEAAALLARQASAIATRAPRPGTLFVVGGDTLRALCRASGAEALVARAGMREGWGCARLVGGRWDGVMCHSRSGAFGPPDDLLAMCRKVGVGAG